MSPCDALAPPPHTLVPELELMGESIAAHRPRTEEGDRRVWAATALVVAPTAEGAALLLIERAQRTGDRWSGHIALPGGRRETGETPAATAARETREEVGLDLPPPVGRLDDAGGRRTLRRIATFVHLLDEATAPAPEPGEVAAAFWVPLTRLMDPATSVRHRVAGMVPFPAREVGAGMPLWGLTHGIVGGFLDVVGVGWG